MSFAYISCLSSFQLPINVFFEYRLKQTTVTGAQKEHDYFDKLEYVVMSDCNPLDKLNYVNESNPGTMRKLQSGRNDFCQHHKHMSNFQLEIVLDDFSNSRISILYQNYLFVSLEAFQKEILKS